MALVVSTPLSLKVRTVSLGAWTGEWTLLKLRYRKKGALVGGEVTLSVTKIPGQLSKDFC